MGKCFHVMCWSCVRKMHKMTENQLVGAREEKVSSDILFDTDQSIWRSLLRSWLGGLIFLVNTLIWGLNFGRCLSDFEGCMCVENTFPFLLLAVWVGYISYIWSLDKIQIFKKKSVSFPKGNILNICYRN